MQTFMEYVSFQNEYKDPARAKRIIKELQRQTAHLERNEKVGELCQFHAEARAAKDDDAVKAVRDELKKLDFAIFTSSHGPVHKMPGPIETWEL